MLESGAPPEARAVVVAVVEAGGGPGGGGGKPSSNHHRNQHMFFNLHLYPPILKTHRSSPVPQPFHSFPSSM